VIEILKTSFSQTDAPVFQHTPALNQSFVTKQNNVNHMVNIAEVNDASGCEGSTWNHSRSGIAPSASPSLPV
jgi:hypothetical protein